MHLDRPGVDQHRIGQPPRTRRFQGVALRPTFHQHHPVRRQCLRRTRLLLGGLNLAGGLVAQALEDARSAGISLVVLVGDEPYYGRLGFRRIPRGQIVLPGPVDPERLLAAELVSAALSDYSGLVAADRAGLSTSP